MKKKIKDLSFEEGKKLCKNQISCYHCPYKIMEMSFQSIVTCKDYGKAFEPKEETKNYFVCLLHIFDFINKEIEVEENETN